MTFLCDTLNINGDVEKAISHGYDNILNLLNSYFMRSVVLGWALFEDFDLSDQRESDLNSNVKKVKEN